MNVDSPSGLLTSAQRPIQIARYEVPTTLAVYLEYYWSVHWNLPADQTFTSTNIPFPCTHIVFECNASGIFGAVKGSFEKQLSGQGFVLGARFKSGFFSAYSGVSADKVCAQAWDISELFSVTSAQFEAKVKENYCVEHAIQCMSSLLSTQCGEVSSARLAKAEQAYRLVQFIEQTESLLLVEDLAKQAHMSIRSLERLFKEYIGLAPKWVIRLFRLQQMADRMMSAADIDWADLAASLGYFDQAHCIKDFKAFTGKTPSAFLSES